MKIRLTENKLQQIIAESVKKVLKENTSMLYGDTWKKEFEKERNETQRLLDDRKEREKKCWSDPKVIRLQRMGFSKYDINIILSRYDYDISNISFEELKRRIQEFKEYYNSIDDSDKEDYDDYNTRIKQRPTQQSLLRGQMYDGEDWR